MDSCWNIIIGKYILDTDPAPAPLTWPTDNECDVDPNCPLVQSLITNVLNLPWWPECCANGILWWDNDCNLRSICPEWFNNFFWRNDELVKADSTDQTPWFLYDKLESCNPSLLQITLNTDWDNHKIKFCIDMSEADIKITDLVDWPWQYPTCVPWSTWLLVWLANSRQRLCPWSIWTQPCISSQSVTSQEKKLVFNYTTQSLQFRRNNIFYHAEVWNNNWSNIIYTWAPDIDLTSVPCNWRWSNAWWDHMLSCMYVQWTTTVWWYGTRDIVIPDGQTWYWNIDFRARSMCNIYTHAHRMWVCIVNNAIPEANRQVLCDVKDWAFRDEYAPEVDGDATFIWSELFACAWDPKWIMTNLKNAELSWGRSDIFWLEAWTKLRMFIKADGNDNCAGIHPPSKVKLLWHNAFSTNHPKATVAWFSVWKVPIEIG